MLSVGNQNTGESIIPYTPSIKLKSFYQVHRVHGALGRALEHSTSDHWVPGLKPGVFMSGALSSFISLSGLLRSDIK